MALVPFYFDYHCKIITTNQLHGIAQQKSAPCHQKWCQTLCQISLPYCELMFHRFGKTELPLFCLLILHVAKIMAAPTKPLTDDEHWANFKVHLVRCQFSSSFHFKFWRWQVEYKREYSTLEEEAERKAIFIESLRFVEKHNSEGHSYTVGINQFADKVLLFRVFNLSNFHIIFSLRNFQKKEEYKAMCCGLLPPRRDDEEEKEEEEGGSPENWSILPRKSIKNLPGSESWKAFWNQFFEGRHLHQIILQSD